MKVFVTGAHGQLGMDCIKELEKRNHEVFASDLSGVPIILDITDEKAVKRIISEIHPDAIIHCAAWTAVDTAESQIHKAFLANVNGTRYLAQAAKDVDAKMLYLSTDYVFDGDGERPWKPDDKFFSPLNVYGRTKLQGELEIITTIHKYFIVRTSRLFGLHGNNFVKTMIYKGQNRGTVHVVDDQIGSPTYCPDLSRLLVDMIESEKYGYYHAVNEGDPLSWYAFCQEIYRQYGLKTKVYPVSSEEQIGAKRPKNSRLDTGKLRKNGFAPLPDWRDALSRYLAEFEF